MILSTFGISIRKYNSPIVTDATCLNNTQVEGGGLYQWLPPVDASVVGNEEIQNVPKKQEMFPGLEWL